VSMLSLQDVFTKCPKLFLYFLGICRGWQIQSGIIVVFDICLDHCDRLIPQLQIGYDSLSDSDCQSKVLRSVTLQLTWFIHQACLALLSGVIGLIDRRESVSRGPASVVGAASRNRKRVSPRWKQVSVFAGRWWGELGVR
jgi:hypothetical protein